MRLLGLGVVVAGLVLVACDGGDDGGGGGAADAGGDTAGDAAIADTAGADTATTDSAVADTATTDTGGGDAGTDAGDDAAVEDAGPGDTAVADAADAQAGDTTTEDSAQDTAAEDTAQDTAGGDTGGDGGGAESFEIRIPGSQQVECEEFGGGGTTMVTMADLDHVCTFDYDGAFGQVYVQASASGCGPWQSPIYEVVGAWMAMDGKLTALPGAEYDYGGNHHNDSVTFSWEGTPFKYYHSSFGWGWRACQPMDCIQVLTTGGAIAEDGCTKERTLPIVCVEVGKDGTVPALVDTFAPCDGDPNYQ